MHAIRPDSSTTGLHAAYFGSVCAKVNSSAIAHNLQRLRQLVPSPKGQGKTPCIWAVVKADAYGHTLTHALPGLIHADGLAVLSLTEARQCRGLGWRKPILVMGTSFTIDDLQDPTLFPLHLVIDHNDALAQLEHWQGSNLLHVWLRYSGQLRHAGFHDNDYRKAYQRLHQLQLAGRLAEVGHMHHYAHAEDRQQLTAERQRFQQVIAGLPGPICTENSAALLSDPAQASHTDWLRCGIALYGISALPDTSGPALGLKPAMTLQAPIYAIQGLQTGQSLGYGGTFRASHDLRVGLLRCGYADGYPRSIDTDCCVLIDGKKSRIIGKVSMDTISIDLSGHPDAGVGTLATLWGANDLPIETIARSAGTIAAQLCTGLTARVPRLAVPVPAVGQRS